MPTLSAPNTATYTTTVPQESVQVVCTGANDVMIVSWVGPGSISGQRTVRNTTSDGEEIGPLPNSTLVTFAAIAGSPKYTTPVYSEALQALVSGAGNPGLTMSLVGDSILASYWNAGSGTSLGFLGEHSMITWAERFSLGALNIGQVLAVSGTRLAAHVIQAASVNAASTPWVIENGGVNDIVGDNATVSYCIEQKVALWQALAAKGANIISVSVLPVAASGGGSLAKNQKIAAFNAACDTLAPQYNVRRINVYQLLVEPTDANGYPLANMLWDGLHPSVKGAYTAGYKIWQELSGLVTSHGYLLASSAIDGYTVGTNNNVWCENALFSGTGGTKMAAGGASVTGTVADGWDVSAPGGAGTAVCSMVSDPDGFGKALQIDITGAGATDRIELRRIAITNGPMTLDALMSGEIVCRVVSGNNVGAVIPWCLIQVDGVNNFIYGGSGSNSPNAYLAGNTPADNRPYLLRTPKANANNLARTGATLNAIRFFVSIYLTGAGAATIQLSRARGRKIVTA